MNGVSLLLNELYDYNFFCNKAIIAFAKENGNFPEKSHQLFNHILNVHHRWNALLAKTEPTLEMGQDNPQEGWEDIHYDNQRTSFEIITNTDDFELRVDFEDGEGRLFTNTVQDILFHIVNHSSHHRGQIMMDLRNNGLEPLKLDYIFYKR